MAQTNARARLQRLPDNIVYHRAAADGHSISAGSELLAPVAVAVSAAVLSCGHSLSCNLLAERMTEEVETGSAT